MEDESRRWPKTSLRPGGGVSASTLFIYSSGWVRYKVPPHIDSNVIFFPLLDELAPTFAGIS
jgi:hypothetical protein